MTKKKVIISYDPSEDILYKNLLSAWSAKDQFEFKFGQRSPNVPINSLDAIKIKQALTTMLKSSEYLPVIIGEKSHKRAWMQWESERAKTHDIRLRLVAGEISDANITSVDLLCSGTAFAAAFQQDKIISALNVVHVCY